MSKIFPKYIAASFFGPFFFGLGIFTALIFFGTLFDKLNIFMRAGSNLSLFVKYLLCQLPYYAAQVIPMATLLAVLFALGDFIKRGEWKAGQAGGYRPLTMIMPLLLCSLIVAVFHFALIEFVSPVLYMKSQRIYHSELKGKKDWGNMARKNVSFFAGEGTFISANVFNGKTRSMEKAVVDIYKDGEMSVEISAKRAYWDKESARWIFLNGALTKYDDDRPLTKSFDVYKSEFLIHPEKLVFKELVADGISIRKLLNRIDKLRFIGSSIIAEKTLLYYKLAFTLSNFVMAMIGIVVILFFNRVNNMFNIGIAISLGFLLWAFMTIS
ncbi:MAG: LptF/LptG family permease, partial [Elusimicrobiales bacterium]|nr:LptF/LptG family permease [Elusimicrobiales bacterium]